MAQVETDRRRLAQHAPVAVDDRRVELHALVGRRQGVAPKLGRDHELGGGEAASDRLAVEADRHGVSGAELERGIDGHAHFEDGGVGDDAALVLGEDDGEAAVRRWRRIGRGRAAFARPWRRGAGRTGAVARRIDDVERRQADFARAGLRLVGEHRSLRALRLVHALGLRRPQAQRRQHQRGSSDPTPEPCVHGISSSPPSPANAQRFQHRRSS